MKGRGCELCNGEAALYCPSDSAFLCWNCDAKVHRANFLVARHVRCPLCSNCNELITDNNISGAGFQPFPRICRLCSFECPADDLHSLSSSSSSACISYAESSSTPPKISVDFDRHIKDKIVSSSSATELSSSTTTATSKKAKNRESKATTLRSLLPTANVDSKAEDILVSWCTKLGLSGVVCGVAVPVAVRAFGVCSGELRALPSRRVSLTASLWLSLRLCGDKSASSWQVLKRLEEMSGVPAKLIFAWDSKLARFLSSKSRSRCQQPEEGWAETH